MKNYFHICIMKNEWKNITKETLEQEFAMVSDIKRHWKILEHNGYTVTKNE